MQPLPWTTAFLTTTRPAPRSSASSLPHQHVTHSVPPSVTGSPHPTTLDVLQSRCVNVASPHETHRGLASGTQLEQQRDAARKYRSVFVSQASCSGQATPCAGNCCGSATQSHHAGHGAQAMKETQSALPSSCSRPVVAPPCSTSSTSSNNGTSPVQPPPPPFRRARVEAVPTTDIQRQANDKEGVAARALCSAPTIASLFTEKSAARPRTVGTAETVSGHSGFTAPADIITAPVGIATSGGGGGGGSSSCASMDVASCSSVDSQMPPPFSPRWAPMRPLPVAGNMSATRPATQTSLAEKSTKGSEPYAVVSSKVFGEEELRAQRAPSLLPSQPMEAQQTRQPHKGPPPPPSRPSLHSTAASSAAPQPSQPVFHQEDITDADFLREDVLGHGSYSIVTVATHLPTQHLFALKEIPVQQLRALGLEGQLAWEINLHRRLRHPNIVRLYSYFTTRGYVHLVLEYCPGGTLMQALREAGERRARRRHELRRRRQQTEMATVAGSCAMVPDLSCKNRQHTTAENAEGALHNGSNAMAAAHTRTADEDSDAGEDVMNDMYFSEETAARYTRHIARALSYLHHHGILHRDLKLENILLDSRGVAKLADFGWSKRVEGGPSDISAAFAAEGQGVRASPGKGEAPQAQAFSDKATSPTSARKTIPEEPLVCGPAADGAENACETPTREPPPRPTVCGTLDYLSPEMLLGERPTYRSDVWSLGIMVAEMLTGRPPFYHDSQRATMEAIKFAEPNLTGRPWAPHTNHGTGAASTPCAAGEASGADAAVPVTGRRNMSESVERLVRRMLAKEAAQRPSIDEVLAHPWLRKPSA